MGAGREEKRRKGSERRDRLKRAVKGGRKEKRVMKRERRQ